MSSVSVHSLTCILVCLVGGMQLLKLSYACTLEPLLFKKGRSQGRATCIGMSCGLCVMSE